jgi:hypothetical protein
MVRVCPLKRVHVSSEDSDIWLETNASGGFGFKLTVSIDKM